MKKSAQKWVENYKIIINFNKIINLYKLKFMMQPEIKILTEKTIFSTCSVFKKIHNKVIYSVK